MVLEARWGARKAYRVADQSKGLLPAAGWIAANLISLLIESGPLRYWKCASQQSRCLQSKKRCSSFAEGQETFTNGRSYAANSSGSWSSSVAPKGRQKI